MCGWVLNLESMAELWAGEGELVGHEPPNSVCRIFMYIFICFMYYMYVFEGVNPKYS